MEPERPARAELAELVPDHRFGDVHRHVLAPVVHGDRVADHVGDDRGTARPCLDDTAFADGVLGVDLLEQVIVDERALLQAARHGLPPTLSCAATADDERLRRLRLVTGPALRLAPRRHGRAATGRTALATTERVVDGVHRDAAGLRADALPAIATGF